MNYPHAGKLAYRLKKEGAKVRICHLFIVSAALDYEDWLDPKKAYLFHGFSGLNCIVV